MRSTHDRIGKLKKDARRVRKYLRMRKEQLPKKEWERVLEMSRS